MTIEPLTQLPGTPYSRFNVPVDYMPSRDYRSRWGTAEHPALGWMVNQFSQHRKSYLDRIEDMNATSAFMAELPEEFDHALLPMPAWYGAPYAPFDAVALCTMIRTYRPKLFLEIGSGISTCFARFAIDKFGLDTKIVSIDPDPRAQIDSICDEVIRDTLESCDLAMFDRLGPNDILFFDGSHRAFMNSDVTVFFGDLLPRIRPGTLIHIHDITLPYDYPDSFKNWYWNEQFLLMSLFLGAGTKINPILPTCYICKDPELFSAFRPEVSLSNLDGWTGGGAMWFSLNQELGA